MFNGILFNSKQYSVIDNYLSNNNLINNTHNSGSTGLINVYGYPTIRHCTILGNTKKSKVLWICVIEGKADLIDQHNRFR